MSWPTGSKGHSASRAGRRQDWGEDRSLQRPLQRCLIPGQAFAQRQRLVPFARLRSSGLQNLRCTSMTTDHAIAQLAPGQALGHLLGESTPSRSACCGGPFRLRNQPSGGQVSRCRRQCDPRNRRCLTCPALRRGFLDSAEPVQQLQRLAAHLNAPVTRLGGGPCEATHGPAPKRLVRLG
jgi:hypothetical protein